MLSWHIILLVNEYFLDYFINYLINEINKIYKYKIYYYHN